MFNQRRQFRRPGTLCDPGSFKIRQYGEQYGLRAQQDNAAQVR
jgi:hypothetical protein